MDRRESATGSQFPTTLGGIRVHIGDQLAPLAFVSPAQINYLFPPWPTSAGSRFYNPTITIEHVGKPFIPKGISAPTVLEAPGFFSVGSSGLAAALAVRVSSDGIQTPVPVFDCSQSPCTAVPIDTSGDPVYLSLFGTGINNFNTTSPGPQFTCLRGTVTYVGPQGALPGLQQVNIRLNKPPVPGIESRQTIFCTELPPPMVSPFERVLKSNSLYVVIK